MTLIDYVWLDSNRRFRWKTRNTESVHSVKDVKQWNYDGSSCGQADGNGQTEITLKPVFICRDPFRGNDSKIVLCETYKDINLPTETNTRCWSNLIFEKCKELKPWFGIEQEYYIYDPSTCQPMGCDVQQNISNIKQGNFYCKMGNKYGRHIAEKHLQYCLAAGLTVSGMNAEVGPAQWEYQIGPCEGINASDELLVSRYILERVAEEHGKSICWVPKPIEYFNGSGCHTNFSTQAMRDENGLTEILQCISRLQHSHTQDMTQYGENNYLRMTGLHETSSYKYFSYGYGTRNTSIRIGNEIVREKKGYFEDRRPASNMDPYKVTGTLLKSAYNITI